MPGLTPMFTIGEVLAHAKRFSDKRVQAMALSLAYVGEEFVIMARKKTASRISNRKVGS